MKLVYKGKFDGNEESLPCKPHQPNAVRFRECDSPKKLGLLANLLAVALMVVCAVVYYLRVGTLRFSSLPGFALGCLLSLLTIVPHELLHAVCFRDEVYLYTNLKQGMLFVVGPETMSRARFVLMSLLPNLVFGFVPFLISLAYPSLTVLAGLGILAIGMGAGDYYNVWNALTQMPRGARTYLYRFHSYWYIPE